MVLRLIKANLFIIKNLVLIEDVDIVEMLMFNKVYFCKKGYKYYFGYKDDYFKNKPSCIMLLNIIRYGKGFGEAKCMFFSLKMVNC